MKNFLSHSRFRIGRLLTRGAVGVFSIALVTLLSAHPALAQNDITLGQMFCNMQTNMENFGDLFSAIAYIAGAGFIGFGLYDLVKHHDNPRERPLHHPILKIVGGAALMAAPEVAYTLINTFFTVDSGDGVHACNVGQVTPTADGVPLDVLIENLVGNINGPFVFFVSCAAVVIGLFLIVRGLMKAARYNTDPRSHSMSHILISLSVGTLLIVVGQSMDMILGTLFGAGVTGATIEGGGGEAGKDVVANWAFVKQLDPTGDPSFPNAIAAALMFFQLVGLIAFVRGWMILKSAAEGQGQATMAQGITHILGGAIALNVFNFLEIMDATFGTGFLN